MSDKRNYGIDLLRILAMFFVVVLHVLSQGGILYNTELFSFQSAVSWLLETAAYCAVNCYALISGYVAVDSKFRYSRIIPLWLQVFFLSAVITALFMIFSPESIGFMDYARLFLPVTNEAYWYLTGYFAMFFFIPFFNKLLNSLERKQLIRLIVTVTVLFSIWPTIAAKDVFYTQCGYSMLWLSCLYLVGGSIKKLGLTERFSKKKALVGYFICIMITWGFQMLQELLYSLIDGRSGSSNFLIYYTSPTMLFAAFFLVIFFSKLEFRKAPAIKAISFLSPFAFGVYLIHTNPLIWSNIFDGAFKGYLELPAAVLPFAVLGTALGIYLICSAVDCVRFYLFKLLKVGKFSEAVVKFTKDIIGRFLHRNSKA